MADPEYGSPERQYRAGGSVRRFPYAFMVRLLNYTKTIKALNMTVTESGALIFYDDSLSTPLWVFNKDEWAYVEKVDKS